MRIPVQQISGQETIIEVEPDVTIKSLKQQLAALQSSSLDELTGRMTKVDLVVNGTKLKNMDDETLTAAGISDEAEVQVLFAIDSVECSCKECSGRDAQDLLAVSIPATAAVIQFDAFRGCSSLISVTIPSSVTNIGAGAFQSCSSLTSLTIPDSVTYIGASAFQDCTSLTSIRIPESVNLVDAGAFKGCSSLTSVTLSAGTGLGWSAFADCPLLTVHSGDETFRPAELQRLEPQLAEIRGDAVEPPGLNPIGHH